MQVEKRFLQVREFPSQSSQTQWDAVQRFVKSMYNPEGNCCSSLIGVKSGETLHGVMKTGKRAPIVMKNILPKYPPPEDLRTLQDNAPSTLH